MAKARILVVEDEVIIASDLESILENNGYLCAGICREPHAAEAFVRNSAVDGVLLDIILGNRMPYELCATLVELCIPFGFVTGMPRSSIPDQWLDYPYCEKPFGQEEIIGLLVQMLSKRLLRDMHAPLGDVRSP